MPNPGSWAVVLPDKAPGQVNQLMQTLWMRNMQQQRLDAIRQQRELVRQQNLAKFVGENFKDANYATGTAADPLINQMTATARQKFAKLVHENPNMDEGELEMQMQGELGRISQYSSAIKAGRKQIEEGAQHYQQLPGVDSDSLKLGAINNLIFDTDASGKRTLKPVDKIDLTRDYLGDTLNGPDGGHFIQGDTPYAKSIESYKPLATKGGDSKTIENRGTTTENKYTDEVYPDQVVTNDAKGNPNGVKINSIPAQLPDGTVLNDPKTGRPLQIVSDETFNRHNTAGVRAALRRDTIKYIEDSGSDPKDYPVGSIGYNIISKHVLYNKLSELTPHEFIPEYKRTNSSIVDKMQLGLVDALGRTLSKADERRLEELLGSKNAKVRLAANFDPKVISAGEPYTDPQSGKQFIDVTNAVGGFNTLADKKGNQYEQPYKKVTRVMVDPSNPGTIYTEEDGHIVPYKGNEIDALLTRHAPANDYKSLKEVETINGKIPITSNIQAARQARAEMEYKRRQARAEMEYKRRQAQAATTTPGLNFMQ